MTKPNDRLLRKANLKQRRLPTIGAESEKRAQEAGSGSDRVQPNVRAVSAAADRTGSRGQTAERPDVENSSGGLSRGEGPGDIRFLSPFGGEQAAGSGTGTMRMDRTAVLECLSRRLVADVGHRVPRDRLAHRVVAGHRLRFVIEDVRGSVVAWQTPLVLGLPQRLHPPPATASGSSA